MKRNFMLVGLVFLFGILFLIGCKSEISEAELCACAEQYFTQEIDGKAELECQRLFSSRFGSNEQEARRWILEHCQVEEIYFQDHITVMKKDQENAILSESILKLAQHGQE